MLLVTAFGGTWLLPFLPPHHGSDVSEESSSTCSCHEHLKFSPLLVWPPQSRISVQLTVQPFQSEWYSSVIVLDPGKGRSVWASELHGLMLSSWAALHFLCLHLVDYSFYLWFIEEQGRLVVSVTGLSMLLVEQTLPSRTCVCVCDTEFEKLPITFCVV